MNKLIAAAAALFTALNAHAQTAETAVWTDARLTQFSTEIEAQLRLGKTTDEVIGYMNTRYGAEYFSGETRATTQTYDFTATLRNANNHIVQYWVVYTAPLGGLPIASKTYLSVYSATPFHITLSGNQVFDGVTGMTSRRILVRAQNDPSQNGIYNANSNGAWTKAADSPTIDGVSIRSSYGYKATNTYWVSKGTSFIAARPPEAQ